MSNHSVKFNKYLLGSFRVLILSTDRQTDRQTSGHRWRHNLLGGGKNKDVFYSEMIIRFYTQRMWNVFL